MRTFISYRHADYRMALKIATILETEGHHIYLNDKKAAREADVIIPIISKNQKEYKRETEEIFSVLSYLNGKEMPLIIPVIIGGNTEIPEIMKLFNYIRLLNKEDDCSFTVKQMEEQERHAIEEIKTMVVSHEEKCKIEKQEKEQSEQKMKIGLSNYMRDVFSNLSDEKKMNKKIAVGLYAGSGVPLLFMIVLTLILFFYAYHFKETDSSNIIIYGILYIFTVIISISISKLMFTLAKSYMVEAIRCSDRIHAISFGKFFLDAYGTEASREEVIQAFSTWNIDNGKTLFRNQSGGDYEPQLIEVLKLLK